MTDKPKRRGPGRPREHRLAEDLAVALTLQRNGYVTSYGDLAQLLMPNEDYEKAKTRIQEIVENLDNTSSLGEGDSKPINIVTSTINSDTDKRVVSHINDEGRPRARGIRLSPQQAAACSEAFWRLGVPRTNMTRAIIEKTLYPEDLELKPADNESLLESNELVYLKYCAYSIIKAKPGRDENHVRQLPVSFLYDGENDADFKRRSTRLVIPLTIRLKDGEWDIDAFDCDARDNRTYQLSRITDLKLVGSCSRDADYREAVASQAPWEWDEDDYVSITYLDPADVDSLNFLLSLDGAAYSHEENGLSVVKIPYNRGDWLPRQLLSLQGKIKIDESGKKAPELIEEMQEVAKHDLLEAKKVRARKAPATEK